MVVLGIEFEGVFKRFQCFFVFSVVPAITVSVYQIGDKLTVGVIQRAMKFLGLCGLPSQVQRHVDHVALATGATGQPRITQ